MRELRFCGAMINGHTNGQYLDHPSLYPFWERAEALGAPIYIHPTDPVAPSPVLDGVTGLRRATWEWGFETGSHALRLVFGGHVRPLSARQGGARPSRRDAAVSALALRQPRQALWRQARQDAVRIHQGQHRGDHIGHVLGGAAQLRARRARAATA